jgi:Putative transposase of IS4/5 family (DUF4096)
VSRLHRVQFQIILRLDRPSSEAASSPLIRLFVAPLIGLAAARPPPASDAASSPLSSRSPPSAPPPDRSPHQQSRVDMREVVNGIMYILSTGCQWRYLPKDLPSKSTVFRYFDLWNELRPKGTCRAHLLSDNVLRAA